MLAPCRVEQVLPRGPVERLLVAEVVIDKGLTNESIRRVESVTGDLNECSGVMVTVQELSYSIGSL